MTLNEIVTLIASALKKELDMPFKLQLADRVKVWRARLIRNSVDKNEQERKYFKQIIFVPMQASTEVPCLDHPFPGCPIAVNAFDVPAPLRANNILFDYVGDVTGSNPFRLATSAQLYFLNSSRYSKHITSYTWDSPTISVYNNPRLPMIRIEGIFDDPEKAAALNCKQGNQTDCDFWNKEYPISGDVLQMVIQGIVQTDYGNKPMIPLNKEVPVSMGTNPDVT